MLGIIRFFLASCVVAFHLTAKIPFLGNFAVNFFYVISGFLITLILNDTYKFNIYKFSTNRFLRLYPTYFFFAGLGYFVIHFMPSSSDFHSSWSGKFLSGDWLGNLFIFPWAFLSDNAVPNTFGAFTSQYSLHLDANRFRIVTSSWSVAVELVCYFIIWLFIARKLYFTLVSLVLSIGYHVYVYHTFHELAMAYYPFIAAVLPFSMGSLGYFIYSRIRGDIRLMSFTNSNKWAIAFIGLVAFILNWFFFIESQENGWNPFFYYSNNIIALAIVIILANANPNGAHGKAAKLMGDLSYPVFLCQYFGGFFAWQIIGTSNQIRGWDIFLIGYPLSIMMSYVCIVFIDKPVTKLRDKVRPARRP